MSINVNCPNCFLSTLQVKTIYLWGVKRVFIVKDNSFSCSHVSYTPNHMQQLAVIDLYGAKKTNQMFIVAQRVSNRLKKRQYKPLLRG